MPTEDDDRSTVLPWLCTKLDTLSEAADRDGWRVKLDNALARIRGGAPVGEVLRGLGIDPLRALPDQYKGMPNLGELGVRPAQITGEYLCPHGLCERRGTADNRGREPLCADGTPMTLRAMR